MTLSLNEVEALAKRAARGAGYPWGLAEEAGMATRWLCAMGGDGCAELAALLGEVDRGGICSFVPEFDGEVWRASDGMLCPIATGASLCDRAEETVRIGAVCRPILLVPFAAMLAGVLGHTLTLSANGFRAVVDGGGLSLEGVAPAFADSVTIDGGSAVGLAQDRSTRADPSPETRALLNRFAHRTYAPSTEESRRLGAGSGTSDSD